MLANTGQNFDATSTEAVYGNTLRWLLQTAEKSNSELARNYLNWFRDTYLVELNNRTTTEPPHNPPQKWVVKVPLSTNPTRSGKPIDPTLGDVITQDNILSLDIVRSEVVGDFVCSIPSFNPPNPVPVKVDISKLVTTISAPPGDVIPVGTIIEDADGHLWIRKVSVTPFGSKGYYDRVG